MNFSAKYIVFGASFAADGSPLDTADTRFYNKDSVTGTYIPITLGTGAEYDGGLVNAIPISEPLRSLKKIERIYFETSYQPAGTPLLQADVRAVNNVIVFETTLRKSEYNGFGTSISDHFTISEVALVGAKEHSTSLGSCECDPRDVFLTGTSDNNDALLANAGGAATISIDSSESEIDMIKEGDQIKIVSPGNNRCRRFHIRPSKIHTTWLLIRRLVEEMLHWTERQSILTMSRLVVMLEY